MLHVMDNLFSFFSFHIFIGYFEKSVLYCNFAFSCSRSLCFSSKKAMFSLMESSFACNLSNSSALDCRAEFIASEKAMVP